MEVINSNPQVVDASALPTRQTETKSELEGAHLHANLVQVFSLFPAEEEQASETDSEDDSEDAPESVDPQEIYDLISSISDPEHPLTLGQLSVVNLPDIQVFDYRDQHKMSEVVIRITPTITHCSLATLIGLGIRVRLDRALPPRFRITILLKEGSHQSENQVNKQLNDKERVAAACENEQLLSVISKMLATCK